MRNTFVGKLFGHTESRPEAPVYRFLDEGEVDGPSRALTYGDLGLRTKAIGAALQESGARRALMLYPAGPEFAETFFGCLAAGVVAVPAPLPEWETRSLRRLRRMVAHADVDVVLAPRRVVDDLLALCAEIPELAGIEWLATDDIASDEAARWQEPDIGPDSLAFLQYTSGSTSAPRGVMLTHANLLHNQGALAVGLGHDRDLIESWDGALFASWLPMYHDMGLIAPLLQTVYHGAHSVLMSPLHFLQRPHRWLRAVSEFRAHTSGGPNFAYELCVRRVTPEQLESLDLSRWRVAFNGSEPVRPATVRRFAETFAPAGFRPEAHHPVYGLAEATLIVTAPEVSARPVFDVVPSDLPGAREVELTGVGQPVGGMAVAIVDPERGHRLDEGAEGEIWVAGGSVAAGYFRDEQAGAEVFGATLPGDDRRYLRTGDLGFFSRGQLFVTGRRKDLLIVDGRNHYPQDIEATVETAHEGIRAGCVAAFSVDIGIDGEQPVVVAEVRGDDPAVLAEIAGAVRAVITTEHGLALAAVVLIRPATMFKTSSGKVQRSACRQAYLSGELLALSAAPIRSPEDELDDYDTLDYGISAESAAAETGPDGPSAAEHAASGTERHEQTGPGAGPTVEEIRSWLVAAIARQAELDPERIDAHRPLVEFGLGSADLVELVVDLSDFAGRFLDTNLFFDHPTIAGVAEALAPAEIAAETDTEKPDSATEIRLGASGLEPADETVDDAIAILSMSCRFPGSVDSPEALWRMLDGEADGITDLPAGRWNIDGLYDPDTSAPGRAYTFRGGYIDGLDLFDAAFFGIGPREAAVMDPQQRVMLQLAWEAIERSGRDPRTLHGSQTGVYLGLYSTGYLADPAPEQLNGQVGTGLSPSVASGRISYTLGLHGPAVSVDTACSSSIVAVHQAVQALRAGECDAALAGGVTLLMSPTPHIELSRLGVLSPRGTCAPFSAEADGTVWAEGAGMIMLKRLTDARRDGDRVLAVIRGSAVNQDGRSQGLSAPNGAAQEQVLRSALRATGLSPHDIDYVEAHGTGTALGDPIEARALARVYGPGRDPDRPLGIGSLKSNLGHTQAAAGVAGIIKLVLALGHERIPATLNARVPSPQVDWEHSGIAVQAEPMPWPARSRPRRAAVSAFGLSGTNTHLILEQAPPEPAVAPAPGAVPTATVAPGAHGSGESAAARDPGAVCDATVASQTGTANPVGALAAQDGGVSEASAASTHEGRVLLLPISARSEASLLGQARRLRDLVLGDPTLAPGPIARSLAFERTRFERRAVVIAADRDEMLGGLTDLVEGRGSTRAVVGTGAVLTHAKTAFVFPGQGAQWVGMARDLLERDEDFRAEFLHCDKEFAALLGWSLADRVMTMTAADLIDFPVVQPLLFATMAALAASWRAAGVIPDAVVGHSQGEIAAAYCAGVLELGDAARIVVARSRLMSDIAEPGAMAIVGLPEGRTADRLAAFDGRISIAAVNVGRSTIVAGEQPAVEQLLAELEQTGVYTRLGASGPGFAGHCRLIEAIREPLTAELSGMMANPPVTPWYSTVSGAPVAGEPIEPEYWYRNARETVRFAATIEAMIEDGFRYFVELGVHPSLTTAVQSVSEDRGREVVAVGSLVRDQDGPACLAASRAALYVAGHELDWGALLPESGRVDLPTYAFDERRFWTDPIRHGGALGPDESLAHPILGAAVPNPESGGVTLTGRISRGQQPWVSEHAGPNTVLLPGASLVEMAVRAGDEVGTPVVRELVLRAPLLVPERDAVRIQVVVGGERDDGGRVVRVYGREDRDPDPAWTLHAEGMLAEEFATPVGELSTVQPRSAAEFAAPESRPETAVGEQSSTWPPEGAVPVDVGELYATLAARGHHYGPLFRAARALWRVPGDGASARAGSAPGAETGADGAHDTDDGGTANGGGRDTVEFYAEIELDEAAHADAAKFGIHPALLDAALHATTLFSADTGSALLPFVWSDVTLTASGATALRVRLTRSGPDSIALTATDPGGRPVISVGSVLSRPVDAVHWDAAALAPAHRRLFTVRWTARRLPAPDPTRTVRTWDATDPAPADIVVVPARTGDSPGEAHAAAQHMLAALQRILADPRFERSTVVVRTTGAVALPGDDEPDPAGAVVWGLVRSAQSENPGRIVLADIPGGPTANATRTGVSSDGAEADRAAGPWDPALSAAELTALVASDEPQWAVRAGVAYVPRLAGLPEPASNAAGRRRIRDGAVLITGAPGRLGSALALHLADAYGARDLVLVSRRGIDGPGGHTLRDELTRRGVRVRFARCDITDRAAVADLLADLPLAGVVHAATVLDDGTLGTLTPERLDAVLRPKVDAAQYLHELTADRDLSLFVLFSAAGGLFGTPGQANYAAANAYLDALAVHRRRLGLPAQALAWGAWEVDMHEHMSQADIRRITRAGVRAFSVPEGMACFDAALRVDEPIVVPLLLDAGVLRHSPELPSLLRGLVRGPARRAAADRGRRAAAAGTGFAERLRSASPAEAAALARTAVAEWTGQVLGHDGNETVALDQSFQSLGLDSLMAVELRNKVREHTGIVVPLGAILADSDLTALAGYLLDQVRDQDNGDEGSGTDAESAADVPDLETLPLTRDMVRLLRTEQLGIPSAAQTGGLALRLPTTVTRAAFQRALTALAHRHAALRTTIRSSDEHGRQLAITRESGVVGGWRELDGLDDAIAAARFRELMARPFDLATGPLWRFELLDGGASGQILLIGAHHSMSDVQSVLLVAGELAAELSGAGPLADVPTNRDMRQLLSAQADKPGEADEAVRRWREAFAGARRLELGSARPAERTYGAAALALDLPADLHDRAAERARELGITPAAVFLGALTVFLARHSGADRFALAVPVDTRMHADAVGAVGYFGVPVPFPAAVEPGEAVSDVLRRIGERLRGLLVPGAGFGDVLAALAAQGLHRENAPMVEVYFNYLRAPSASGRADLVPVSTGYSDLDLMVAVLPDTGRLWLTYNSDILDEAACSELGKQYLATVAAVVADPGAPASVTAGGAFPAVVRAALGATFALGRIPELLGAASAESTPITVAEAPYHHLTAALRDPSGVFAQPSTALAIALLRAADLQRFGSLTDALLAELAEEYPAAVRAVAERTRRPIIVGILPSHEPDRRLLDWERTVADRLRDIPGVALLETAEWTHRHAVPTVFDERTDIMAHLPFTAEFQAAVALTLADTVAAVTEPAPKVIVVDGDDTLWSGIAGEIGADAVLFDDARLALTDRLRQWRAAGTLLALVSNNDDDVVRAILDRADSPVRYDDFAAVSAGWEDKPARVAELARTLHLGLAEFCYLDDNPVEVARMRAALPEVLSVTCPPAADLPAFLTRLWPMTPVATTAEDRARADYYRQERQRDDARASTEFGAFLEHLGLEVDIEELTERTGARARQLVRRTNQFTLGAAGPDDLDRWRAEGEVWTATARDRFGEYGLIGVLALRVDDATLTITGWHLSCRALGRGVEERLFAWIADRAEALDCATVRVRVEHTARNTPARRLVARLAGLARHDETLDASVSPRQLREFRSWTAIDQYEEETTP
ncbi:HAD-IIIC family phosphatase [Nocardia higoensis]|uniref:HAD-IIIC family phosphatase n=1 Tax=Nocardia higoensis TaxID=228599 RepID=A0ABS0D6C3_9NOCA|nr:type I polyketide synthase [Nocardia higoensis]MBF6353222.1 HAD-IIIC family phosphatase [Nocardia higoensis]